MTGYASERQRAHNLEALIHRVVPKPFTLDDVCNVVSEVLREAPPRRGSGSGSD
jgi:DNA-binding response OmpR family regulator